ncbi:GNAT family N-acetyltransferase [Jatrophihabitans sp.]|uniref:GNAT family N-acetyltransferase n=1 Tax=Jatrophihabitans sp. TaxID=1932789 RepID=UPI002B58E3EE|nr:GNAT family N-acetyltransferase [Jatrophihabitans sp.]
MTAADGSAGEEVTIGKDEAAGRYEIFLDGRRVGLADYFRRGDVVVIPHTETLPQYGGRGLASQLVRYCLDDIRAQGLRVRPSCPFVAAFIRKNPEYADLVAQP